MRPTVPASEKSVVCVRHGETIWKVEGRTHGQLDAPLTDNGISQVHRLADELVSENFGMILSSSLGRTLQTTEILSQQLGVKDVRQSNNLVERFEGSFQGLTREQQSDQFPECFDNETGNVIPNSIPGVEPTTDFLDRVSVGLREIGSFAETARILVVTHAGVLQAFASLISGEDFVEVSSQRSFGFCDVLRLDSSQI